MPKRLISRVAIIATILFVGSVAALLVTALRAEGRTTAEENLMSAYMPAVLADIGGAGGSPTPTLEGTSTVETTTTPTVTSTATPTDTPTMTSTATLTATSTMIRT